MNKVRGLERSASVDISFYSVLCCVNFLFIIPTSLHNTALLDELILLYRPLKPHCFHCLRHVVLYVNLDVYFNVLKYIKLVTVSLI